MEKIIVMLYVNKVISESRQWGASVDKSHPCQSLICPCVYLEWQ